MLQHSDILQVFICFADLVLGQAYLWLKTPYASNLKSFLKLRLF
jgi:hypothetical protein